MESETRKKIGRPVPILAPGFGTRVKVAADAFETRAKAADATGVSADMIQRYIREASVPGLDKLECLAAGSGIRYRWLAYAEEPVRASSDGSIWSDGQTIGQRIRIVRCGVENLGESAFAARLSIPLTSLRRLESGEETPSADLANEIAEKAGVRAEWLSDGTPPMLEVYSREFHQIIDARLKRAASAALATGSGNIARYPTALEQAMEQMPPSAAMRGERVSLELLTDVVKTVEAWLHENRNKVRLSPDKKAMLIAIAYAHFEGRTFQKQEMEQFFRLVA